MYVLLSYKKLVKLCISSQNAVLIFPSPKILAFYTEYRYISFIPKIPYFCIFIQSAASIFS